MNLHTLQYGTQTIEYELQFANRKTLGITVHPDLRVTVQAPQGSSISTIEAMLRRRGTWILRQQREFEDYLPTLPPRQYVSGETHLYLGKRYRLKVVESDDSGVKLSGGRFYVQTRSNKDLAKIKALLDSWYRERATQVFSEQLFLGFRKLQRYEIPQPALRIRTMKKRWGSCTKSDVILLNLKLIQVPKYCIDYVIMHELVHLKEHHHGPAYYALLDRLMPDWEERRHKLHSYQVA